MTTGDQPPATANTSSRRCNEPRCAALHVLAALLMAATAAHGQMTTWTSRASTNELTAELRSLSLEGKVILRKPDGQYMTTWLDQLSEESIDFIRETGGDLGKMLAYEDDLASATFLGFELGTTRRAALEKIRGRLAFGRPAQPSPSPDTPVTWVGDIDGRTEVWTRLGNDRFHEAVRTQLQFRYGRLVEVSIYFRVPADTVGESKLFEALLSKLQDKYGDFSSNSSFDIDADEVWQGAYGHAVLQIWRLVEAEGGDEIIVASALHHDLDVLADRAELQELKKALADF